MKMPRGVLFTFAVLLAVGCAGAPADGPALSADVSPLHLEEHLDEAVVTGSDAPADMPAPIEWTFDREDHGWQAAAFDVPQDPDPPLPAAATEWTGASLLIRVGARNTAPNGFGRAVVWTSVPDLTLADWSELRIRARSVGGLRLIRPTLRSTSREVEMRMSPLVADSTVQTYRMPLPAGDWQDPVRELVLVTGWNAPVTDNTSGVLELLSLTLVPRGYEYRENAVSVHSPSIGDAARRAIVTHSPSRLEWRVRVPEGARLDLASGLQDDAREVRFRVSVTAGGDEAVVFEEASADASAWQPRSVDLSPYAGRTVQLALETQSEREGTVAFWGAPTVAGRRAADLPNVVFYVIDGAGADWMSLYGYNRRTTPFLERLARDAVVFEQAYSNATSTPLSAPSYMTSLLFSAIMPHRSFFDRMPDGVTTMAEHFARNGWQTGVFSSNPHASSARGLDRNVDVSFLTEPLNANSSDPLGRAFWEWRDAWAGQPFWAHFQTTDVHEPFRTVAPFAGLFLSPEMRERYFQWDDVGCGGFTPEEVATSCAAAGTTVEQFALAQQALYDEGMAHQDYQLERLVARLQAEGQYENTILVIASDHGYPAGGHRQMPGIALGAPYIHPFATRVPLLFVWPGHIAGGRRIRTPVSMLDVLPTLLDLAGLPQPDLKQGQSLAPLLLGQVAESEWETRPVIVEVLVEDLPPRPPLPMGNIEVIDGRWGASLCVRPPGVPIDRTTIRRVGDALVGCVQAGRPERLLVYDLWEDPLLQRPINAERPDLVEKYTALLEAQLEANAAMRQLVGAGGERVALTPEQLEMLRTLGYIR